MLIDIAKFEVLRHLKKPSTYIYFLGYFTLTFFWTLMVGGAFDWATVSFDNSKLLANGSFAVATSLTAMGVLGLISAAAFMGQAVYQDFHYRMHALIYVRPISKFDYLLGRFVGTFLVLALIFLSLPLAFWLATVSGLMPQKALGPNSFGLYLTPYVSFVLTNMLWAGAIFFALASVLRKMMPVYIGSLLLLVGWMASSVAVNDLNTQEAAALFDPFGMHTVENVGKYWSIHEKNTALVSFEGSVLLNRLLWLIVGLAVLFWCYVKFDFVEVLENKKVKKEQTAQIKDVFKAVVRSSYGRQLFDAMARRQAFFSLLKFEMWQTLKNRYFVVLLLAAVSFVVFAAGSLGTMFGTRTYPTTYMITDILGGGFQFFVLIVIIFYAGELVWREKDHGIKGITDAMPVPHSFAYFAKLTALMSVIALMLLVILFAGVIIQLASGYYAFDWHVYFGQLYGINFVRALLLAVLALFIQVVAANKYSGHAIMILVYMLTFMMPQMGIDSYLLQYGKAPTISYSDMNGFGSYIAPHAWYIAYWLLFAGLLMQLTIMLWPHGEQGRIGERLAQLKISYRQGNRQMLFANLAGFILLASYLSYNHLVVNPVSSNDELMAMQVDYEKSYREEYQDLPQPSVIDAQFNLDIQAAERKLSLSGNYLMKNLQSQSLDRVFINLPADLKLEALELDIANRVLVDDSANRVKIIQFNQPLRPGERFNLNYRLSFAPKGISQRRQAPRIFHNGTFLDVDYFPLIGFLSGRMPSSEKLREQHGLGPAPELPEADDPVAVMKSGFSGDTHWVTSHYTISTDADQIALAPGELKKQWKENGRAHFVYEAARATVFYPAVLSARYAVKRDKWQDVDIEIYYHPRHDYNIDDMIKGVQVSLDVFTESFGEYPFGHLRIVEFPRFSMFAQSFPGIIPYSEAIGFIARLEPGKKTVVDYPFYVTAHEMAHQWWPHQTSASRTKGANMLSETLAQYSALVVMEKHHGEAKMREFLRQSLDRYLSGRGSEKDEEKPLMTADNRNYVLYDKGGLVMYALRDYIGGEKLDGILKDYLDEYKYAAHDKPYPTSNGLVARLRRELPEEYRYLVDDMFENITLMDMRAEKASAVLLDNGQYEVTLTGLVNKQRMTGTGETQTITMNDMIDVVVLDEQDEPIYSQKHAFKGGRFELKVVVDGKPVKAGVDSFHKLIDRLPDDNTTSVKF